MSDEHPERFTAPRPLPFEPRGIARMRGLIEETGGTAAAMAVLLRQAGITVGIEGDTGTWLEPGQGAIVFGDHSTITESVPLLAVLGEHGREDVRFIGKPYSLQARVVHALGATAANMLLPIYSRALARDRPPEINYEIFRRLTNYGRLPTDSEISRINQTTLDECVRQVSGGSAVILHPAGIGNPATQRWRHGIGHIIRALPAKTQEKTALVSFRMRDFSSMKLARSILMWSYGLHPPAWKPVLQAVQHGSVSQEFDDVSALSSAGIAEQLRQRYIQHFSGQA